VFARAASCGEFRRNPQDFRGICNGVVWHEICLLLRPCYWIVSCLATVMFDSKPNEVYFLYPDAKQFRAASLYSNFPNDGNRAMPAAYLKIYTLYAIQ
jgi:hypothetical protein